MRLELWLLLAFMATIGSVPVHEAGHALAALLLGFRVREIGVFRLRLQLDGPEPRLIVAAPRARTSGHVSIDTVSSAGLRWRLMVFDSAGVLTEFVVVWLLAVLVYQQGVSGELVLWTALYPVVRNVAPVLGTSGQPLFGSDGRHVRDCLLGGSALDRRCVQTLAAGWERRGLRPREWDGDLIASAALGDGSPDALFHQLLAYYHALDNGDSAAAVRLAGHFLHPPAAAAPGIRRGAHFEAAYVQSRLLGDAATARAQLDAAHAVESAPLGTPGAQWKVAPAQRRAEVALLLLEGRPEAAQHLLNELAQRSSSTPTSAALRGSALLEVDLFDDLVRLATAGVAALQPATGSV